MSKLPLIVNFQIVSSQQSVGKTPPSQVKTIGDRFARMIINDVMFSTSDYFYKEAKQRLVKDVTRIIHEEIQRMAKQIAHGVVQADEAGGLTGRLEMERDSKAYSFRGNDRGLEGIMSNHAAAQGWTSSFDLGNLPRWAARDPQYLRRKRKQGGAASWFQFRGGMSRWLRSRTERAYISDFGGVAVSFEKAGGAAYRKGSTTATGKIGRPVDTAVVGTLRVRYFGKISAAMMPEWGMGKTPTGMGLAALLPNNKQSVKLKQRSTGKKTNLYRKGSKSYTTANGRVRTKSVQIQTGSTGGSREYRPAIDPFVQFYATRSIPNAIWRRLERVTRG
jgi:hypothetical protein